MKPKTDVGIIFYNNEHADDLVKTAVPLMEEVFKDFYKREVPVHVEKNEDEIRIYAHVPEPNGQSLKFLMDIDKKMYVPLVENWLGAEGYVPFIGDKRLEDIYGYAALAKIFANDGKLDDAEKMFDLFIKKLEGYGIIKPRPVS